MNAPDKSELFQVPEGHNKVEFAEDPKIANAEYEKIKKSRIEKGTFTVYLEDHTLGNPLRMQLLRDKDVKFSGYKVPHPLFYSLEVKIQTNGNKRPTEAFIKGIEGMQDDLNTTLKEFDRSVREFKDTNIMN